MDDKTQQSSTLADTLKALTSAGVASARFDSTGVLLEVNFYPPGLVEKGEDEDARSDPEKKSALEFLAQRGRR